TSTASSDEPYYYSNITRTITLPHDYHTKEALPMRRAGEIEENRRQDEPVARVEEQTETKRPRLKLTYLYELIEALREDHRQLSARVDELSKLLDTAERWNSQAQAAAAHETTPAETP